MTLTEWRNEAGNVSKAQQIRVLMRESGLLEALNEGVPKGQLPIGSGVEDVCRALGEITGYNQCLLNLEVACRPTPPSGETLDEMFGG